MNTQILAENAIKDVTKFRMEDAIELGRGMVGITLLEMKDLVPGKVYSPTRPITMKKGSSSSGTDYNPSTNITPDQSLQFVERRKEDSGEVLEFLGADQMYTMTTEVAFSELEPLYFVHQTPGSYEMSREFCIFDVFGVDRVVEEIRNRYDNKSYDDEKQVKELYTNVVKEVLDPLIDKNLLVEYKVLDGGEKTIIVQAKTTPKGTYVRLELGL